MSRRRRSRAPETRTDAADTGIATILANSITGAGDDTDVNGAWAPLLGQRELWPQELERLAETWIGQLAIETKPRWLWTAGVRLDLDGDLRPSPIRAAAIAARTDISDARKASLLKGGRALIEQHLIDLGARDAVREAHEHALQMGGAGILIRTYPQAPLHLPLDMTGRVVTGLVPMSGYHLRVTELGNNPLGTRYQRPTRYAIDHTGTGSEWWASDVHWSHVLDFMGPRRRVPELSWGAGWSQWPAVSVLQTAWDAIRSFVAAGLNAEDAARRLSVFVIKHPDYSAKMANNPGSFQDLLTTITQKLSTRATYHAPPGGDVNTASLGLGGMGDINRFFQEQLPLALGGIPYALVFDAAGSGLSKDTLVWDSWTTRLTGDASACGEIAAYTRLYHLVAPSVYANPPALRKVEPGDFLQPSDADRMALRVQGANEAAAIIAAGIAPAAAFEEARYQGTFNTDVSVPEGWRVAAAVVEEPAAAVEPAPTSDADPIVSPEDIPDDIGAEAFAAKMTEIGAVACEHGFKNKCPKCGIERVRQVEAGPDGQPVFGVAWRALRTDAASYSIPAGAAGNAKRALRWKEEHPNEIRGMTSTGWARARQLAKGGSISAQDITEIRAWFARHGAQSATKAVAAEFKSEPWRDAGYVSWLGWGGDTMRSYVADLKTDADFSGTAYLWLPVPEQERAAAVQRAVADLVPLEGYGAGDPMPSLYHVTVLDLGATSQARYRDVQARAPLAAGQPITLIPRRVIAFPAQADGRSPIVIELEGAEVGALHDRLREVLAPLPPDKYTPFVAHMTLGYARLPADLDLGAIPVPAELGEATELRLTYDGRDTVWPL